MTQTKTVIPPSHMAALATIAKIVGIDLATFKTIQATGGQPVAFVMHDQFQQAVGPTKVLAVTPLETPTQLKEIIDGAAKLIQTLKASKLNDAALIGQLDGHLIIARDTLTDSLHAKQNGKTGEQAHVTGEQTKPAHQTQ